MDRAFVKLEVGADRNLGDILRAVDLFPKGVFRTTTGSDDKKYIFSCVDNELELTVRLEQDQDIASIYIPKEANNVIYQVNAKNLSFQIDRYRFTIWFYSKKEKT